MQYGVLGYQGQSLNRIMGGGGGGLADHIHLQWYVCWGGGTCVVVLKIIAEF